MQKLFRPDSAPAVMMLATIFWFSEFMIAPSRPLEIATVMMVWFINLFAGSPYQILQRPQAVWMPEKAATIPTKSASGSKSI